MFGDDTLLSIQPDHSNYSLGALLETEASVQANLGPYDWHADTSGHVYLWKPGDTAVTVLSPSLNWTTGPNAPPQGGNDTGNYVLQSDPDPCGKIYYMDAPGLAIRSGDAVSAPLGSIISLRFATRQWVTSSIASSPALITEIATYAMTVTIKKTSAANVSPITYDTVQSSIQYGSDSVSPLTVAEAQGF